MLTGSIPSPIKLLVRYCRFIDLHAITKFFLGKKLSCREIVLYCLNLPPHLWYLPENILIIGLMPPPHLPNPTTISHLLDPITVAVAKYGTVLRKMVSTFDHPEGVSTQARIIPLISDLEASCKVSGFLSHAAIMFCSFCLCTIDQIEAPNMQFWQAKNSAEVRAQAEAWLNQTTKTGRQAHETETGV
jgi:hypothetical protein